MNTAKCMEPTSRPAGTGSRFERNRLKALELFAQRGFAQVSLRELASHLELTVGSLYNHCACKEELLQEFIEEHYMALLSLFDRHHQRESASAPLQEVIQKLIGPERTSVATLELFEHMPLRLSRYPLTERQRYEAFVQLLTATTPLST
ncbi:TetR/AcrR family transcriptional regulator [Pseudomonas stutzeri]|uniref:TetR/AcrR family transcriptional regulator n=1 Tax=Stutzerimonas stutzeri TaxID=316 RepID=UPI00210B375A|nr:TetR family transcriptional regulator [Stutzerimonas stutzeri]MCQ4312804.1 TetR/AcrR family transcriptional regulator [Stutzerimonas stutzeri]